MSDWKEYTLEELCDFQNGFAFKNSDYVDSSENTNEVFRMGYINRGGGFKEDTTPVFVPKNYPKNLDKFILKPNDITIAMTDMKNSMALLGYCARISHNNRFVLNQRVGRIRVVRNDILDPIYLYYYLNSSKQIDYLRANANSGVQVNLGTDTIKKSILKIPSIEKQREIANILFALDQKIELNIQINQTLEQIAQALFKSWFVDFDPVRAKVQALSDGLSLEQAELAAMQAISRKTLEELTALSQTQPDRYAELAETAKAFPCEMVEVSNSIYIPKGWKIKYFNEIIDTYIDNRGKTPPIEKQGIPLLEVKHLPKNSVFPDLNTTKYISNDTYENWLRNKPEALDIMLSTVGTVGRVNLVPTNNKIAIAQNILGFRFNLEKATQIYMFYLMKSEKFIFDMEARVVETVQKSIKRKDLEKIPLLIPTLELQNLFSKFVIPFVIKQNNSENTNLEKIRNDLLPKLLSGEIQL